MDNLQCWAVVPAGGSGSRFSATEDKLLTSLAGQPVLVRTIAALSRCAEIHGIVVTASASNLNTYKNLLEGQFSGLRLVFALGGDSRRASVLQGLVSLPDGVDVVVIHDAARPLIRPELVRQAIHALRDGANGSIVAIPFVDTVKQVDLETLTIRQTLDRTTLWRAQTPQAFRLPVLLAAHLQTPPDVVVTDDAQLLELAGLGPVRVIPGVESNLKITCREDLPLAESFLRQQEGMAL